MDEGYVNLWRKSLDSFIFENPELWKFWCWCLMKATWKPFTALVGFQTVDLIPGQFIFGRDKASIETGLSVKKIRNFLIILKKRGNTAIKTTNKYSIITINNWDTYQNQEKTNGQQKGQQRANKGPTKGHIQEVKELKEGKEHKKEPSLSLPFHTPEFQDLKAKALSVLNALNSRFGKKFPPHYPGLNIIIDRLREGHSPEECERIMEIKERDPHFQSNRNLYRPETLFKAEKFDTYLNEEPDDFERAGSGGSDRETRIHTGDGQPYPDDTPR